MSRNGRPTIGLLIVLGLFLGAAWWVFAPNPEPDPILESDGPSMAEEEPREVDAAPPEPAEDPPATQPAEAVAPEATDREEVLVVPEGGIVVRVVDPTGQPVQHVVVAVGMQVPGQRSAFRFGTGRSDADGLAVIELDHAQRQRRAPFPPNPEIMIDARFASTERVRAKLLLEEAQAEVTELRLPEVRTVRFGVETARGEPVDFPFEVTAQWAPADADSDSLEWSPRRPESLPLDGDEAVLVCGLGMRLQMRCWDSTSTHVAGGEEIAGPSLRDPSVTSHTLRFGPLYARFRARLLDLEGKPYAGARIGVYETLIRRPTVEYPEPDRTPETRYTNTIGPDEDGRIDLVLPITDYTQRFDRSWAFVLRSTARDRSLPGLDEEGARQVKVPIPLQVGPGEAYDVGDLTLQALEFPILVAGRVVNLEGNGIPTMVSLWTVTENWQDRARIWNGRPERDGSFEVRAPVPENGLVQVTAGGFGYLGADAEVPAGTTDLEFVLTKGNTLRGRLILPDNVPFWELEIRMPGGRAKEVFPGGVFAVDYLAPSEDSWVSLEHHGREVWRSEPIVIEGEGNLQLRPAAVQDVDVRSKMRLWATQCILADGTPINEELDVRIRTEAHGHNWAETQPDGRLYQLLPTDVDEVILVPRGCEAIQLSWPPPAQVVLRKSVR